MAEENFDTPIGDLDSFNAKDFEPQPLPEPPVNLKLEAYLDDMGYNDQPGSGGIVPEIVPGSPEDIRNDLYDMQTGGLDLTDDPFKMGKTVMGDFRDYHNQNQFYERYATHSEFENLGFSPFRDNETLYNENSNFFEEMGRTIPEWGSMISLGFADAAGWSTGTDRENAEAMERSMAIASSSKGGFTGFTNNLFLNSGYTVGIMGELALEEIALIAVEAGLGIGTVGSGGAAAPALAANTALMGARATRAFGKIGKAWKAAYKMNKQLHNLQDINKARSFWQKTGRGAKNLLNPFENTTDFLRSKEKLNHLQNWKKTYKGFAEFYKDARNMRLAFGEGGLEGGMVQNQMERELLADFKAEHGRGPNEAEGLEIQQTAAQAGLTTTYINAPVIMLSNKLVIGGITGRGRFKNLYADVIETGLDGKIIFKPGVKGAKAYSKLPKGLKGKWEYIKSPRMWAGGLKKYGKANVAEGLQETFQETITSASEEYYTSKFLGDPVRGGYMSSLLNGLNKQISPQGLETFMSGFLMGGMVSPIATAVGNVTQAVGGNTAGISDSRAGKVGTAIKNRYVKKFQGDDAYNKRVKEQEDTQEKRKKKLDEDIEMLNDFYEDPTQYFSPDLENLVDQKAYKQAMDVAEKTGNKRMFHDMKDAASTKHITTALKYGRLDGFVSRLEGMKQFTPEEFKDVDTQLSQEDYHTKIDNAISRAKQVQRSWDMASEKFPNPFNPHKFRPGTEMYMQEATNQIAWDNSIEEMVFNQQTFNRTLERQKSILEAAKNTAGVKNMSTTDLNVLFTEDDVMQEIALLKTELQGDAKIAGLEQAEALTEPMKKMVAQKKAKLKALEKYDKALKALEDDKGLEKEDKDPKTIAALRKAYKNYMQVMAKQSGDYLNNNDLDKSFDALVDYYTMNDRTASANTAVNLMLDPLNFKNSVERKAKLMDVLKANREVEIRKSLEEYRKLKDQNQMLNDLYDKGMFFDPKELEALQKEGRMPKNFYYVETTKEHKTGEVVKTSADYAVAIGIVTKAMKKMGIDVEDVMIMEEANPYSSKSRIKSPGDNRRYEDYAEEFGFDATKDSSEVPLKQVLEAVMKSKYATEHEKALAEQLLKKADDMEKVIFSKSEKIPNSYTSRGAVIDARYSSDEYAEGRLGTPIEHLILHTEILRRVSEATKNDPDFKEKMIALYREARNAYSELSLEAQAAFGERPKFLQNDLDLFMAEAMSNATVQEFLATVQTKVKTTESAWKRFVNAVLAKLKGALGSNGTVLNATLDLITAKIDTIAAAPTTETTSTKETTTAAAKPVDVKPTIAITNTMSPAKLKAEHPDLLKTLLDIFKNQNIKQAKEKKGPLLIGFETMTPEDISKTEEFAAFLQDGYLEVDSAFYSYNISRNEAAIITPLGSTFDVSDEEIESFKSTGKLSRRRIIKLGNKLLKGETPSLRESSFLENEMVKKEIEEYQAAISKPVPTVLTTGMQSSLRLLGFPMKKIQEFHSKRKEAARHIAEGITWDELQERKKEGVVQPYSFAHTKEGENFREEVQEIIDSIYNWKTYLDAVQELEIIASSRSKEMRSAQMTTEDIENYIGIAQDRLINNFTFEELEVGEVVMMDDYGETLMRIEQIGETGIILEPYNVKNEGDAVFLKKDEAIDKIKYRYSEAMNDDDIKLDEAKPITEEEEGLAAETMKVTGDTNSTKTIKEDLKKAGTMTAAERWKKLKENKKCN